MTTKYGLLGHPLGHSFSKKFHNERFAEMGIDAVYENFDLENINDILDIIKNTPELKGFNVTIPYKQDVMQFLSELDPMAERIGAVNTVKVGADGKLKGYNTDIIGFTESIKPLLKDHHKKALILGTGGASKAIKVALEELGIEPKFVSRTASPGRFTYEDLSQEIMSEYTVIVNCSPVGMYPKIDQCPAIPYEYLSELHVCFDAVYNPDVTLFMEKARKHGASAKCGYEMLVGQAIASYDIWTSI